MSRSKEECLLIAGYRQLKENIKKCPNKAAGACGFEIDGNYVLITVTSAEEVNKIIMEQTSGKNTVH